MRERSMTDIVEKRGKTQEALLVIVHVRGVRDLCGYVGHTKGMFEAGMGSTGVNERRKR